MPSADVYSRNAIQRRFCNTSLKQDKDLLFPEFKRVVRALPMPDMQPAPLRNQHLMPYLIDKFERRRNQSIIGDYVDPSIDFQLLKPSDPQYVKA